MSAVPLEISIPNLFPSISLNSSIFAEEKPASFTKA